MIPVAEQQPPNDFDEKVTTKAREFLVKYPKPTKKQIDRKPYWRFALDDLYRSYGRICAYSGLWCQRDAATVDHFLPVAEICKQQPRLAPELAYDWHNFRLASPSMNREKRDYMDVVDPFTILPHSFVIDFPSMMIKAGPDLPGSDKEKVNATIKRLKLNTKERYKGYRLKLIREYCREVREFKDGLQQAFFHLERMAPFIAYELKRQKLTEKIIEMVVDSPRSRQNKAKS
jgi:hypothetical protein